MYRQSNYCDAFGGRINGGRYKMPERNTESHVLTRQSNNKRTERHAGPLA